MSDLARLQMLPIDAVQQPPTETLQLPLIARQYALTNYDAAYLALAMRLQLPLATTGGWLCGERLRQQMSQL